MVANDATPRGETLREIAERYHRAETTVRNQWSRHPEWPEPLPQKRGRSYVYPPDLVDEWYRAVFPERPAIELEPTRLYTAQQLEDAGIGLQAVSIRSALSRGHWPEPDDTSDGVNRWYGATITEHRQPRNTSSKSAAAPAVITFKAGAPADALQQAADWARTNPAATIADVRWRTAQPYAIDLFVYQP